MNGENYDIILGVSTYYTESNIVYVFMTSYLYVPGESELEVVAGKNKKKY